MDGNTGGRGGWQQHREYLGEWAGKGDDDDEDSEDGGVTARTPAIGA